MAKKRRDLLWPGQIAIDWERDDLVGHVLNDAETAAVNKANAPKAVEPDETQRRYTWAELQAAFEAGRENSIAFEKVVEEIIKGRKS